MDEAHRKIDAELAKIERKLSVLYARAYNEASEKCKRFWSKFAELDEKKRKLVDSGEMSWDEYIKWRENKMKMGHGYYAALVDTLSNDMTRANQIAASIVNGHLPGAYAECFNYSTYQIERGSRIDTSFTMYDRQTVERMVKSNPDVIPIKPKVDIPKDKIWNKQKINAEITQGILQGDSIPDIAKRMKKVAGMNGVAATRTARTAMTSAENGGRVDSYKRAQDMGIKLRQRWLATLDGRTRDSHRALDGETIPVSKDKWHPSKFSNGCRFPGDPQGPGHEIYNCRCTLIADVEGVDQGRIDDLSLRRHDKLGGMSYEEWKNEHKKRETPTVQPTTKPTKKTKQKKPEKPKRNYDSPIAKAMERTAGRQVFDASQDMLDACKNGNVREVFRQLQDQIAVGNASHKGGAYHQSGAIYWNAINDAAGSSKRKPFSTLFHESGHGVDYWLMEAQKREARASGSPVFGRMYSTYWQNGRFGKTIASEVDRRVKGIYKTLLEEYRESRHDIDWLEYRGLIDPWNARIVRTRAKNLGITTERLLQLAEESGETARLGIKKPTKSQAYAVLEEEIKNLIHQAGGDYAMHSVSDIIEGATKGKVQPGWGHGKSYWRTRGVEMEAFAEMVEAYISGPESLEMLEEYFPESVGVFNEMMADALELLKRRK